MNDIDIKMDGDITTITSDKINLVYNMETGDTSCSKLSDLTEEEYNTEITMLKEFLHQVLINL